jgi:hypothetical protein
MENFNLILTKKISDEVRNVLQVDEKLYWKLRELLEEPLDMQVSNQLDGLMFLKLKTQIKDGKFK